MKYFIVDEYNTGYPATAHPLPQDTTPTSTLGFNVKSGPPESLQHASFQKNF